ncbi:MAG: hypothetical protein HFI19_07435 [Lachnospiraceae bacterium]|jgi:hypothetical protein|nr:hypothetical protein [Lachnospiraceae bacterium]
MFNLFGKKESSPKDRLAECQRKHDWAGLARAYYQLGVDAMNEGDLNKANLWLHRADTIYSARDEVYKKVGEELVDDCSERIGELEDAPLLYNDVPALIEEKSEGLRYEKVRVWGLLSLARLVRLGEQLASLPGCEALGKLGWAVDTVLKSFQGPLTKEEFQGLRDLGSALYQLGDDPAFWGMGSEIPVSGGAPFQVFDFNGLMGIHLEIDAYLDSHLGMLCALADEEEPPAPETGIIAGALMPDYYIRTGMGKPEENPRIQAELQRIWSDYEFAGSDITWEMIGARVAEYKKLDILA